MKNITISIDDEILDAGRKYAQKHNISLNTLIRKLLAQTVLPSSQDWIDECFQLMDQTGADSGGRKWRRRIYTMSKVFIDTNILIYAMDKANPVKQDKARSFLRSLRNGDTGVISTQILREFYVTGVQKLRIAPLLVKSIIHSFNNYEIVVINPELINEAIDCGILNQPSFWDSLVIAAAESAHCCKLMSEDLNHGQVIRGVQIVNPFLQ